MASPTAHVGAININTTRLMTTDNHTLTPPVPGALPAAVADFVCVVVQFNSFHVNVLKNIYSSYNS